MVTITESGMTFGPFSEDQIYRIEKADAYIDLGEGVKAVEFVYRQRQDKLFFIEAKSSSPMPKGEKFENYIGDIAEKFLHSFGLWLTLYLKRRTDKISPNMLDIPVASHAFRFIFILVINGHRKEWLPPIKAAIARQMMAEIKIWKHEVIVINDEQARERGLILKQSSQSDQASMAGGSESNMRTK